MATLAELKLIVDSSQLEHAKKVLDEFGVSASNVESSGEKISKGVKSAGEETDGFSSKAQRLIDKATEMVETFNQGSAGVLSYRASLEGVGGIVDPLVGKFNSLKDTQKEYVEVSKEVVRSQQQVDSERLKMISSLKEEIALFGKSKEEIRLYRAEQLGIIDTVAPLVGKLEELKKAKEDEAKAGSESAKAEKQAREDALKLAKEEADDHAVRLERARNLQAVNSQLAAHEKQMAEQRKTSLKKDQEIAELKGLQIGYQGLLEDKKKDAEAAKRSAEESKKQASEFAKLKASIDPVSAAYDKLDAQLDKISKLKSQGGAGVASVLELERLEEVVHKNIKQLDTLGATTGKTAKEMAFSMRGLPAQFTDIVVSLQGGQKPLTVLLQQGGQIKDMFGGIVPAFKSMAGYVVGLLTPLNLLIAGVGVLAVGYYRGASQIEDLNKSIIRSGKIATVSSGQLLDYAEASSQAYGTVSQAIPIVSQLSAETSLAEDSIVKITSATLAWSSASGVAVEDIIKDFVSLGKDPVKAAEELNKQYKFLTVSLYENIRALEESGRSMDATKVASAALAEAIEDDARLMVLSLGTAATAWHKIKSAASSALDSLDSLGRVRTEQLGVQAQLDYNKALEEYNNLMERKRKGFAIGINGERLAAETLREAKDNLDSYNRAQERSLNQPVVNSLESINKSYEAVRDRVSKAEKALADFDAQSKAALSSDKLTDDGAARAAEVRAKLQREYNDAKREEAGIDLVAGAQASLDLAKQELETGEKIGSAQQEYNNLSKEFEQIQRNINEGGLLSLTLDERRKHNNKEVLLSIAKEKVEVEKANEARKESLKISKSLGRDDAATKMLQSMVKQSEVLKEQLTIGRTLGAEEKKLVELKQMLSDLELKSKQGILTLDERSILNNKESLLLAQQENTELEKRIKIKKREVDLEKFKQGLQESLITSKGGDTAREGFGVGDKEAGRIKERNELLKEEAKSRRDIENARSLAKGEDGYDSKEFDDKLAALEEYYSKRKGMLEEYYEVEDEMQGDWLAGMQSGFETFLENQEDLYTTMKDMTENLLTTLSEGISDSISNAIISGESLNESMYKLGETIRNQLISSLVEMAVQYSINAAAEILAIKTVESAKRAEMVTTATMAKTQTLANASVQATAGASTAAAWSPAAIAASIGSFGAAAAVGLAAVVAAMASFGGFKSGGYTGNMGVNDVAGVVHGKEYVFDAAATARIGVGNLERLRSGGDFQQGGGDSSGSVRGSRTTNVNQVINVSGEVDNRTANQISYETYSRQRRAEARFNR